MILERSNNGNTSTKQRINMDLTPVQSRDNRPKAKSQLTQYEKKPKPARELPMANVAFFVMTRSHQLAKEKTQ